MSRAYRIKLAASQSRVLRGEDHISMQLDILEILPCEEMAQLLSNALRQRGFELQPDGTLTRVSPDGSITVQVDPMSGCLTVKSLQEQTVHRQVEEVVVGYDDMKPHNRRNKQAAQVALKQKLDDAFQKVRKELEVQAAVRLSQHLRELQPEIDTVVNEVTREAIKIKACQLGMIKEIHEDAANGSLTITLEV